MLNIQEEEVDPHRHHIMIRSVESDHEDEEGPDEPMSNRFLTPIVKSMHDSSEMVDSDAD